MGKVIKESVKKGFSLVELSVVLAILGLLTGGILAGQALLNNQRKNAIITKANNFRVAIRQFQLKYMYLPGDFPTATQVWGRADGGSPLTSNCAAPNTDNANPSGTCNGNGDNLFNGLASGESPRAWQQLRLAGFIEGQYNGVSSSPIVAGVTVPTDEAKLNSMFGILSGAKISDADYYDGDYTGGISYGVYGDDTVSGAGPVISGEDAYTLDGKIDDALPASGAVRAFKQNGLYRPDCPSGNAYPVTRKDDVCALIFMGVKERP